jgi:molecular chaperone HtpG
MLAEITLPSFLTEKLAQAPHRHVVHKALENFSDWFRSSRLPFFPDYTDHGIQHIEQVLATAANLIPDQARQYFSGADAAALILAVLLHDSALHLTDVGVWQLIKGPAAPYSPVKPFDQKGWAQTWDDFMFLARRWDDTKLAQVFGSTEPGGLPTASVRDPFAHWQNLTRTDNLLIGEFIRQQHPRLAHEMALYGVPGTTGALLKLDDSLPAEWRDLVGLIARSHGLPLRTCLDYLKNSHDFGEPARREYQGVHAVYLMALLRVADYIQIQGDRTSNRIFNYRKIYSSVSTIEHKVHQSVRNITNKVDDPEALFIQARPEEVSLFLRLKEWLAGIQQELDGSWAVLGEVYGRDEELRNLGLTFRRVRSNLDDVAEFAKTVPYVPDRIRFDVARAELLKLLIGPLYGDDPSYGVRELMQNAIDAVREYDQFVLDNPQYKDVPRREQEADVVVELSPFDEAKGYAVMTVSDRGIGMREETIRDYFLRAGASYRNNPQWKTFFEEDSVIGVKSKVLRSGRFGVGALASFLIGGEIQVTTRYVGETNGYRFESRLSDESIRLLKDINVSVGTQIKIKIGQVSYHELANDMKNIYRPNRWDWYCGEYPEVVRKIYSVKGEYRRLNNRYRIHDDYRGWRKLQNYFPYSVYWTFDKYPSIICNNIFINDATRSGGSPIYGATGHSQEVAYPSIAIVDPDGLFPLNLQRDRLQISEYPFDKHLVGEVFSEALAWLFFSGPSIPIGIIKEGGGFNNPIADLMRSGLVTSTAGYGLTLSVLLNQRPIRHLLIQSKIGLEIKLLSKDFLLFVGNWMGKNQRFFAELAVLPEAKNDLAREFEIRQILYDGRFSSVNIPSVVPSETHNLGLKSIRLNTESYEDNWITASSNSCPKSEILVQKFPKTPLEGINYLHTASKRTPNSTSSINASSLFRQQYLAFEERFYPEGSYLKATSKPWLLDELWLEHFGREWIPFDLKERIAKFPKAAQFFKERYPQVVPDEVWALIGGKPDAL